MMNYTSWSLPVGQWVGIKVRLHMVLLLFIACTLYLGWRYQEAGSATIGLWMAVESLLVVISSVVVHEVGHAWATRRLGGATKVVVLGPLGGGEAIRAIPSQRAALLIQLAGPTANLLVCLACLPLFLLYSEPVLGLIPPLMPLGLTGDWSTVAFSRLVFWINWVFLFINLMPVYPFDGSQILQTAIALRWPRLGAAGGSMIVSTVAKILAAGLFAAAMLIEFEDMVGSSTPTRFALIVLSIVVFFCARQQEQTVTTAVDDRTESPDEVEAGNELITDLAELEQDLESFDEPLEGPLAQWLESRRESRRERRQQQDLLEERELDALLERIHEHGVESLTAEQRDLLQRVSARYRTKTGR